jgi:hypothetical protein
LEDLRAHVARILDSADVADGGRTLRELAAQHGRAALEQAVGAWVTGEIARVKARVAAFGFELVE